MIVGKDYWNWLSDYSSVMKSRTIKETLLSALVSTLNNSLHSLGRCSILQLMHHQDSSNACMCKTMTDL